MQVARRSLSLSIKIIYNQVLRDKKKEPAVFWSANFPRLRRQFKYILNNFRLSKLEENEKNNKPKRNSRGDQKSAEIKLKATLPAGPFHWIRTQELDQFSVFTWRHQNSNWETIDSSVGFCTLCFCFPTKMLHLNAPFFSLKCSVFPKKSLKCSDNAHYTNDFLKLISKFTQYKNVQVLQVTTTTCTSS